MAARPTDQSDVIWPTVPRAAGIDEAITWLSEGFNSGQLPRFVFLVGGPGAGKSHAAAGLARELRLKDVASPLALRTYRYATPGRDLFLVNDATISSAVHRDSPLSHEIDDSVALGEHFFACVNRGVLVEEVSDARAPVSSRAGLTILQWIQSSSASAESRIGKSGWDVETLHAGSYIRAGTLFLDDKELAELVVVYVDVNSLLEKAPRVSIGSAPSLSVSADRYEVTEFELRRKASSIETPAGALFEEVFENLVAPDHGDPTFADPFESNLTSLLNPAVREGVLSVLRAAEITASQRMTFREIWGALSRCLIGGANTMIEPAELEGLTLTNQPHESDSPEVSFEKLRTLANYRFTQALFGSSSEAAVVGRDPVLRLTHLSDPVRDAIPGRLSQTSDLGWASAISDAFSGDSGGSSPLSSLLHSEDGGDAFAQTVTRFDHMVDASYIRLLKDKSVATTLRRESIAWYGSYLTRLFAVSNGIPAFRREVSVWTVAHGMSPGLPSVLETQLTTLLKPVRYPEKAGSEPLFPVFESRTNPIRGDEGHVRLAIRSKNPRIVSRATSDSMFVVVVEADRPDVEMLLDFAMVREAMACADGYTGSTELSETTSPRLERFRAARLVPGKQMDVSNYRVVLGNKDLPLKVEGQL